MNVLSFDVWPRGPHVADTFLHCASLFSRIGPDIGAQHMASTKDQGRRKSKTHWKLIRSANILVSV